MSDYPWIETVLAPLAVIAIISVTCGLVAGFLTYAILVH